MLYYINTNERMSSIGVSPRVLYDEFTKFYDLNREDIEYYYGKYDDMWFQKVKGKSTFMFNPKERFKDFKRELSIFVMPDGRITAWDRVSGTPLKDKKLSDLDSKGKYSREFTYTFYNIRHLVEELPHLYTLSTNGFYVASYMSIIQMLVLAESSLRLKGTQLPDYYLVKITYDYISGKCSHSYPEAELKGFLDGKVGSQEIRIADKSLNSLYSSFSGLLGNTKGKLLKCFNNTLKRSDSVDYSGNLYDYTENIELTVGADGSIQTYNSKRGYVKTFDRLVVDKQNFRDNYVNNLKNNFSSYSEFLGAYQGTDKPTSYLAALFIVLKMLDISEKSLIKEGISLPSEYTLCMRYDGIRKDIEVVDIY